MVGVLGVALVGGGITWAVIADHRWEQRCHAQGGYVEERYEGQITTIHHSGNSTYVTTQPNYSSHCWVAGREVKP